MGRLSSSTWSLLAWSMVPRICSGTIALEKPEKTAIDHVVANQGYQVSKQIAQMLYVSPFVCGGLTPFSPVLGLACSFVIAPGLTNIAESQLVGFLKYFVSPEKLSLKNIKAKLHTFLEKLPSLEAETSVSLAQAKLKFAQWVAASVAQAPDLVQDGKKFQQALEPVLKQLEVALEKLQKVFSVTNEKNEFPPEQFSTFVQIRETLRHSQDLNGEAMQHLTHAYSVIKNAELKSFLTELEEAKKILKQDSVRAAWTYQGFVNQLQELKNIRPHVKTLLDAAAFLKTHHSKDPAKREASVKDLTAFSTAVASIPGQLLTPYKDFLLKESVHPAATWFQNVGSYIGLGSATSADRRVLGDFIDQKALAAATATATAPPAKAEKPQKPQKSKVLSKASPAAGLKKTVAGVSKPEELQDDADEDTPATATVAAEDVPAEDGEDDPDEETAVEAAEKKDEEKEHHVLGLSKRVAIIVSASGGALALILLGMWCVVLRKP